MNKPEHFELREHYAYYRPEGHMSLEAMMELVRVAIVYCAEQGHASLLVNITALTGLEVPTMADRFFLGSKWAEAAQSKVAVAVVMAPELIHPQKFGVTVARNRGATGDVFTSEAEAEAWLLVAGLAKAVGERNGGATNPT